MRYLYLTSKTIEWQLSDHQINESESIPGLTLNSLFTNESVLLLAYNDEQPTGEVDFTDGHTKGVVATDGEQGIWLIHSVPKYPSTNHYDYPKNAEHYGQSFLCISFEASQMDTVGQQLIFNEPNIYSNRVPKSLKGKFSNLERAIAKDWKKSAPYKSLTMLTSFGGRTFSSFAKGKNFNGDLYEDWLAPAINVSLYVETWRNGPGNLVSNCSAPNK